MISDLPEGYFFLRLSPKLRILIEEKDTSTFSAEIFTDNIQEAVKIARQIIQERKKIKK